jgi:hypothetical protein
MRAVGIFHASKRCSLGAFTVRRLRPLQLVLLMFARILIGCGHHGEGASIRRGVERWRRFANVLQQRDAP